MWLAPLPGGGTRLGVLRVGGVKRKGRRTSRGCRVRGAGRGAGTRVAGFLRAVRRPPAFVRRRRRRRRGEPVREAQGAGRGGA